MKKKKIFWGILRWFAICCFLLFILLPVLWMFGTSLKSPAEQFDKNVRLFPQEPMWENYTKIWSTIPLAQYFGNSLHSGYLSGGFRICVLRAEQISIPRQTAVRRFRLVYPADARRTVFAADLCDDGDVSADNRDSDDRYV